MKLLIADDDNQIRTGMKEAIDWSAIDINQVVTASNGIEALQLFNEVMPEIVVTDVRMPGMDGLELLKEIKKVRPQTRVIILSGFNDFEYLKRAIQLGAVDYEMKPIRARSLIALIRKIKEDIIREQMTEHEFQKYLQSYKSSFRSELIAGNVTDRLVILEGLQQYYGFDGTGNLIYLSVQMDSDQNRSETSGYATDIFFQLFNESELAGKGICLKSSYNKLVILLKTETPSYLYYQQSICELMNLLRDWNDILRVQGYSTFSAGISGPGQVSEFMKFFSEANQAMSMRFYEGNSTVYVFNEDITLQDLSIVGLLENNEFKAKLLKGDLEALPELLKTEFNRLKLERRYSKKSIATYTKTLLQYCMVTVRNLPADVIEYIQNNIALIEEGSELWIFNDFEKVAVSVFEKVSKRLSRELSPVMVRADEYIRKNFTHELSVEKLSAYVGKTPNYFSHRFKLEFGVSFKEYINRLRIDKAKELIVHTNDLIYEISEQVGFSDYIYFTQVFKKIEGHSPGILRKQAK
ncbi:response regulator transcription factor [Paenibacillus graminis]|uniref:AraC family transcriptional regulator n=1 Tax=Paenibacillus graminis TaxID=189425 RepID=A0A089MAL3_9BACL|nr:response regulator [Paenibacillus graminis]AIQ70322.1 hypothetical protein PGRAT_23770 [Paenibacillus graminis]